MQLAFEFIFKISVILLELNLMFFLINHPREFP